MDNYCFRLEDPEENWITDQNDQEFTHDYLAATKIRSLLEDQIIENEEDDVENMLLEDEDDESYEILEVKILKRSSCVIFDNLNGEIKRCNSTTKLVSLSQLIETWEVEITLEENLDITELEVCSSHFNFDNSKLYSSGAKQRRKTSKSIIHRKKYLLCNKYKRFFSRGNNCIEYCWNICGKEIQVPCLGFKSCSAFQIISNITSRVTNNKHIRYICTNCFENNSGHLYIRQKSENPSITCVDNELHNNDTNHVLRLFSNWLSNLSYSQNKNRKEKVLWHMMKLLEFLNSSFLSSTNTEHNLSSPLLVKIAMKINKLENYSFTDKIYAKAKECRQFGEMLGELICDSRDEIKKNCNKLENPLSLNEYYASFPLALTSFLMN
ncbi:hypothetical protein F8M41_016694 [Gigaspora margarita]|uniref:Uncharacterized protein n=1 Tax=Gigaspora margarita TaxID=4874 RepID=A0A8H4AP25_GIGMA|nr:hypothetical protein F8M41_016694 [Gigaspora margarita]